MLPIPNNGMPPTALLGQRSSIGSLAEPLLDGRDVHPLGVATYENQSVYVPIGAVHRLANPGKIPLELVEIQTGSYLGEDDIQRFEDIYRRVA